MEDVDTESSPRKTVKRAGWDSPGETMRRASWEYPRERGGNILGSRPGVLIAIAHFCSRAVGAAEYRGGMGSARVRS